MYIVHTALLSHYCGIKLTSTPITVKTTVDLRSAEVKLLSS